MWLLLFWCRLLLCVWYMLDWLLVLLVSSLIVACDLGLLRSSFIGLRRLRHAGLDTDNGSRDIWSSESIEPAII